MMEEPAPSALPQPDAPTKSLKQDELKELILKNQNQEEKGYYTFDEWSSLHHELMGVGKGAMAVINAWRVLKLINFGDDYVPTGLIFDTLVTLLDTEHTSEQVEALIKSIFFKFIEFNGKFLSEQEREELAFFRVIKSVVEGYRKLLTGRAEEEYEQKDRNHQLHRLQHAFTYRKNLEALKKIEEEFKEYPFEPQINPRSELVNSRYMEPKISPMKSSEKYDSNMVIDEEEEYEQGFRASPVPDYPDVVLPSGVNEHVVRMERSREVKRMSSLKSWKSQLTANNVAPFTLSERDELRRERSTSNFKLLFVIKAEVGKRALRVRVR